MRKSVVTLGAALVLAGGAGPVPAAAQGGGMRPAHEGFMEAAPGVRLFYRVVGSGGDTVVVLHGGPGFTMAYLAPDLEPLAARHTLIFYDQRGAGRSTLVPDSAGLDAQRFVDDLEAVRRHFRLERMTLLGHSWGTTLAALYAMRHPQQVGRLLIVGAVPLQQHGLEQAFRQLDATRDSSERRRMEELMAARRANPGDVAACRAYYVLWFRPFYGDGAAAGRSKGDICDGTADSRRNKLTGVDRFTFASLGDWDLRKSLGAISAPTLVIHGTADVLPAEGAREWVQALPNARLLLLKGIGHFPYVEAPDRFFPAVETFLRGDWPEEARAGGGP